MASDEISAAALPLEEEINFSSIYFCRVVEKTDFCGCWRTETINSTARPEAMRDIPGRVTVHCWSRVLSFVDCGGEKFRHEIVTISR